jgi:hypothetical protein
LLCTAFRNQGNDSPLAEKSKRMPRVMLIVHILTLIQHNKRERSQYLDTAGALNSALFMGGGGGGFFALLGGGGGGPFRPPTVGKVE